MRIKRYFPLWSLATVRLRTSSFPSSTLLSSRWFLYALSSSVYFRTPAKTLGLSSLRPSGLHVVFLVHQVGSLEVLSSRLGHAVGTEIHPHRLVRSEMFLHSPCLFFVLALKASIQELGSASSHCSASPQPSGDLVHAICRLSPPHALRGEDSPRSLSLMDSSRCPSRDLSSVKSSSDVKVQRTLLFCLHTLVEGVGFTSMLGKGVHVNIACFACFFFLSVNNDTCHPDRIMFEIRFPD